MNEIPVRKGKKKSQFWFCWFLISLLQSVLPVFVSVSLWEFVFSGLILNELQFLIFMFFSQFCATFFYHGSVILDSVWRTEEEEEEEENP